MYFVRVYINSNHEVGRWMMKIEDFKALGNDANKIKDLFALPTKPSKYSIIKIPAGTRIRTGIVAKVWDNTYKCGNGGGTQFEILNWDKQLMDGWFKKIGDL